MPGVDYLKVYGEITDDFQRLGRENEANLLIADFRVVVALDDIASISLYWEEADRRYFKKTKARTEPLPPFEVEPLRREKEPNPFGRALNWVVGRVEYPFSSRQEWPNTEQDRRDRIRLGLVLLVLIVLPILYALSD
jgi:hypothetical protein